MRGRNHRWVWEAPADQGASAPEGVDDRGFTWPDDVDPEIASRYKTVQDLAKGKREQDSYITRLTQERDEQQRRLAEYEASQQAEPEWEDPLASLPAGLDPAVVQRLDMLFRSNPAEAYDLADQAAPGYGPQLRNAIFKAWREQDEIAALNHVMLGTISPMFDERFQSFEEALAAQLGPTLAHATTQISDSAVELARKNIPDYDAYEARIEAMLDPEQGGNPALIQDVLGSSRGIAERLELLRDTLWAQDERQKQIAAGQAPTAEPEDAPKPKARQQTLGGGSAPRPTDDAEAYAAHLKSSMKGVRARTLGT